jgi:hypothetical protein
VEDPVANHAGQSTLYLSALHGKTHILKPLIANIRFDHHTLVVCTGESNKNWIFMLPHSLVNSLHEQLAKSRAGRRPGIAEKRRLLDPSSRVKLHSIG